MSVNHNFSNDHLNDNDYLMNTYKTWEVTFVRGEGSYLYDDKGNEYLDFLSGIAVTTLGHANKSVVDAITTQASKLSHVSNLFGNELAGKTAKLIDLLIGGGTDQAGGQVFFANSGAEANECAIKLVRKFMLDRYIVLSAWGSFHGRTLATLHATGQPEKHEPFQPLPDGFIHVSYNDYDELLKLMNGKVGAVFLEPIQGENGVIVPDRGYLKEVETLCRKYDALLIVDEIQTGLGRTGSWFSFQEEDISPDIVTIAKALGNGMPIGCCWAKKEVASAFKPGDHGSTFGGQPLALSAALATLNELIALEAPKRAKELGEVLKSKLQKIHGVKAIRGNGLLIAVEIDGDYANNVYKKALENGLVVNAVRPNAIRLEPPLTISVDEIEEGVKRLELAIKLAYEEVVVA